MATGKVKWFNNAKGYGFILPDSGEGDLFAHYSSIQMDGYRTLKAGQEVSFDVVEGPKGNHAVNINYVSAATPVDVDLGTETASDADETDELGEELKALPQDLPESMSRGS